MTRDDTIHMWYSGIVVQWWTCADCITYTHGNAHYIYKYVHMHTQTTSILTIIYTYVQRIELCGENILISCDDDICLCIYMYIHIICIALIEWHLVVVRPASLYDHIFCSVHIKIHSWFKRFIGYVDSFRKYILQILISPSSSSDGTFIT